MIDSHARDLLKTLVDVLLTAHTDRYGGDLLTWMAKERLLEETRKLDATFRSPNT